MHFVTLPSVVIVYICNLKNSITEITRIITNHIDVGFCIYLDKSFVSVSMSVSPRDDERMAQEWCRAIGRAQGGSMYSEIKSCKKNLKVWVHDGIPFFYINILKFGGWGG